MKKVLCWLLALLLAGSLALFGFSYIGAEVVEPGLREGGTVASASVQDMEMQLIRDRIMELAPIYEFGAGTALEYVTPEKLAEMNRQAARWWNTLLTGGEAGEAPALETEELAAAFTAELRSAGNEGADEELELRASEAANAVAESVLRIVLPLRLPVIGIGTNKAAERVDVGNVIRFLTGVRWAALALCALLAGLIALLESRKLRMSLKYIGSAMGAAVLVMAGGVLLYFMAGIDPLITGASPSLGIQYHALFSGALTRLVVCAAVLLVGCVVCLVFFRRQGVNEAETD